MDIAALIAARDAAQQTADSLTAAIEGAGVKRLDISDMALDHVFPDGILVVEVEKVDEDTALAVAMEWFGDDPAAAAAEIEDDTVVRCYITLSDAAELRAEKHEVEGDDKPYLYAMERDLLDLT